MSRFTVTLACLSPLALWLLCTTGCGPKPMVARAYDGPALDKKQVATLRLGPEVRIKSIDGRKVDGIPEDFIDDEGQPDSYETTERHIEVLPGTRRMIAGRAPTWSTSPQPMVIFYLHSFNPGSPENEEIEFDAVAGKTYYVNASDGKRWSVDVTDFGAGKDRSRLIRRIPEENYAKWEKLKGTRWGP